MKVVRLLDLYYVHLKLYFLYMLHRLFTTIHKVKFSLLLRRRITRSQPLQTLYQYSTTGTIYDSSVSLYIVPYVLFLLGDEHMKGTFSYVARCCRLTPYHLDGG